jgi:hypothetical protein
VAQRKHKAGKQQFERPNRWKINKKILWKYSPGMTGMKKFRKGPNDRLIQDAIFKFNVVM